jgi:ribonuclease HI
MEYIYTDGSCSKNGYKDAVAGIGIYFGYQDSRNVSQRIEGKQTNNAAELGAILHLYTIIEKDIRDGKHIGVVTDSIYAIRCCTTYGKKCADACWKKDIPNKEMVKKAYELYSGTNVEFIHVTAHTENTDVHSLGNKEADRLATNALFT